MTRWWFLTVPAFIVAIPLSGFPLQHDEVKLVASTAGRVGANPLRAAELSIQETGRFLDLGTFRPLGRFVENLGYSALLEASEATGLAPHAILGVIRLAVVVALAHAAILMVSAVMRSAGVGAGHPVLLVYPVVLAATLVANSSESPLVMFPFTFTGSVVLVLLVALCVARDQDMAPRRLTWREPVAMALLGAVAATFYDLAYVAPVLAAAYIAARAAAARMPLSAVMRTAAARRWAWTSVGFLAVFVPARIEVAARCGRVATEAPYSSGWENCRLEIAEGVEVAARCGRVACYEATWISVSDGVLELLPGRLLTGLPPVGWNYSAERGGGDLLALAANALMAGLLAAIVVWLFIAVRPAARRDQGGRVSGGVLDSSPIPGPFPWRASPAALCIVGSACAVLPALLVSLSKFNQRRGLAVGQPWRDTVLVQVGCSMIVFALVVVVVGLIGGARARRAAVHTAVTVAGACLVATLFFNWRVTAVEGGSPRAAVTKQMLIAATSNDATDRGNARRCELLDTFEELAFSMDGLLDEMMLDRHGIPFCDPDRSPDDR